MLYDSRGFTPVIRSVAELRRATDDLVHQNIEIFDAYGLIDLRQYPVRYEVEPYGVNLFQNVLDIINAGVADCEDLASWLDAYYKYQGIPSLIVFERQSPVLFHVTVRARNAQGRIIRLDPSRWFGMGEGRR